MCVSVFEGVCVCSQCDTVWWRGGRSHAVWQHVIWTGLLNILMAPLRGGSRPERRSSGPHQGPIHLPQPTPRLLLLLLHPRPRHPPLKKVSRH